LSEVPPGVIAGALAALTAPAAVPSTAADEVVEASPAEEEVLDAAEAPAPVLTLAAGVAAGDADPLAGGGMGLALGPAVAPPPPFAFSRKASKVRSALGFTAKTIPALQWGPWLQKNHRGAVSLVMVIDQAGISPAWGGTAWKPELTPSALGTQGDANVDCVTVWFLLRKWNETMSPLLAITLGGS